MKIPGISFYQENIKISLQKIQDISKNIKSQEKTGNSQTTPQIV